MRAVPLLALALAFVPGVCRGDEGDDPLRVLLSRADLVVLGTIASEPMRVSFEAGVVHYPCDFQVAEVCKGDAALEGMTLQVNIKRLEMYEKDHHPLIKKDAECILFLKKESKGTKPPWVTSDFWFGIQHPSPWMAKSLKKLASQERPAEEP